MWHDEYPGPGVLLDINNIRKKVVVDRTNPPEPISGLPDSRIFRRMNSASDPKAIDILRRPDSVLRICKFERDERAFGADDLLHNWMTGQLIVEVWDAKPAAQFSLSEQGVSEAARHLGIPFRRAMASAKLFGDCNEACVKEYASKGFSFSTVVLLRKIHDPIDRAAKVQNIVAGKFSLRQLAYYVKRLDEKRERERLEKIRRRRKEDRRQPSLQQMRRLEKIDGNFHGRTLDLVNQLERNLDRAAAHMAKVGRNQNQVPYDQQVVAFRNLIDGMQSVYVLRPAMETLKAHAKLKIPDFEIMAPCAPLLDRAQEELDLIWQSLLRQEYDSLCFALNSPPIVRSKRIAESFRRTVVEFMEHLNALHVRLEWADGLGGYCDSSIRSRIYRGICRSYTDVSFALYHLGSSVAKVAAEWPVLLDHKPSGRYVVILEEETGQDGHEGASVTINSIENAGVNP